MTVGGVLAKTSGMFARRYGPLFVLVVIGYLPIVAFWLLVQIGPLDRLFSAFLAKLMHVHRVLDYDAVSLGWIPLAILSGAIAIYVVARLREEPVPFWRACGGALRRAHVIVGVALFVRLATSGVATFVEYLRWDDTRWYPARTIFEVALYAGLWLIAIGLLVPAIQVAAIERRGVFGAFARTWSLARGARFKVFAIVLAFSALNHAINYALYQLLLVRDYDADSFMVYAWVRFGLEVALAPLFPVLLAVTYEHLRAAKEGPAGTQLQRIFD